MIKLFTLTFLACLFSIVSFAQAPIHGEGRVCIGSTTTLTDTSAGGHWISGNISVATVGSSTGVVTGVSVGTCIISYGGSGTLGFATTVVTVYPTPATISHSGLSVCVGSTLPLSDSSTGGSWTSSNVGVATVGSLTGVVIGITTGTANVTYNYGFCSTYVTVTVNPAPAPILHSSLSICVGNTLSVSDTSFGGTWSSETTAVATVSGGFVFGASAGTSNISYTLGGCSSYVTVTVTPVPTAILGVLHVCAGLTSALTDATSGGTWSSTAPAVAVISAGGVVTGVTAGTTIISYMIGGCYTTAVFTVNPTPAAITGGTAVTVGFTLSLSDATAGGTWSSSNTSVATVGSGTGIVTGVSPGGTTIFYTLPTGCQASITIQVTGAIVDSIRGTPNVCVGSTRTLTDLTSGGTWSSSNTAVATVGSSTGVVTGITAGTCLISYTVATTTVIIVFTVNPVPGISGSHTLCAGSSITLVSTPTGGVWSSSSVAVATIGSTGLLTGVAAGTTNITFTLTTGCFSFITVTVNAASPITPTSPVSICLGGTAALSDAAGGGTWSSSAPGVATVSGTGLVTGVGIGTSIISYTLSTGCGASKIVTVNNAPSAITPHNPTICVGSTILLTDATSGGAWISVVPTVASISATGLVTALAAGVTEIDYSIGTCIARDTVFVTAAPAPITPSAVTICIGGNATLTDATAGGTWSSSATGVASISAVGVVTGNTVGTAIISYTVGSCSVTTIVTVNTAPAAITPTNPTVCVGSTVTLTDATVGGAWSSSNATVASVASGIVSGISAGTATISYSIGSCSSTRIVTVNPAPAAITPGVVTLCLGGSTSLSDATAGGTWSSSAAGTVSVTAGGLVTGNAIGTATISYSVGSCFVTRIVTVNTAPGAITPANPTVCVGSTLTLTDATSGGVWSSSVPTFAGVSGGVVTGLAAGTAIISYSIGACSATTVVTVNPAPAAITPGVVTLCLGGSTTLSDATAGGTWSSSAAGTVSVTAAGAVTGNAVGTATISYTIGSCAATRVVTVNTAPAAILPTNPSVCVGSTVTLTDATSGGVWSSSAPTFATVAGGVVTGLTAGTVTISYSIGSCSSTRIVTINPAPAAISGGSTVGAGSTLSLSDATSGGTWSSSNTSVATVGSSTGIVTGVSVGTVTISYTLAGGCFTTRVVTVTALTGIGGTASVCVGSTRTLTDATAGGTWSSSNTGIATVGISSGIVTGVSAGTCIISYTVGTATTTVVFTVNAAPAAISGSGSVTAGTTISLTDAVSGGSWSSSNLTIATVGSSTGIVTGVVAGTATITYTLPGGCITTRTVTVTALTGITGTARVCAGSSVTLFDSTAGGHWNSSNTAVATIGSSTGVVTGISAGTCIISYTVGTSTTTVIFTVNANPGAIAGLSSLIAGTTIILSDAVAGGTWSSSNTAVATAGLSTGIITGVSPGTSTITYTVAGGCLTTKVVTVTPLTGISGTGSVCAGSTRSLSDASPGGVWSSSNTSIATVGSSTGVVTGISAGVCTISYTLGTSTVTMSFTVNAAPATISGGSTIIVGFTMTLSDASVGGTWSTSNGSIATVGSTTGLVAAVAPGVVSIYYTIANGCQVARTITVNPLPGIRGTANVCIGSTRTLTDSIAGGTWSSSNIAIATVGSSTGVVTGVAAGTCIITYKVGTNITTIAFTVNFAPPISGSLSIGVGGTTTLSNTSPGGTWLSGYTPAATVGSATGVVSGITNGTATIYYVTTAGCYASVVVTVSTPVKAIRGTNVICTGSTTTLSDSTTGGVWTSSNTAIATVGSSTGIVSGVSAGTARITYTVGTGFATVIVTVGSVPPITGTLSVGVGGHVTLSDAAPGGSWMSGLTPVATVVAGTGVVTGVAIGTATIYYVFSGGCYASKIVTVHAAPAPRSGGGVTTTAGTTISIMDEAVAGDWISSDDNIATVDGNGTVTAIAAGNVNITHVTTNNDGTQSETITQVAVNPIPMEIRLVPNPNKGSFAIKGIVGTSKDGVTMEITNMLGQVVYSNKVMTSDGAINEQVLLSSNLENGMYLLNVTNGSEHKTFHFVMEK